MKITIGLPVYNGEEFLEDTLRSIQNQTHRDWELIIVDDGSTDRTEEIVRRFMETDSRISFHKDRENKHLPTRLNQIAQLTQTPLLARMDADDIMHPQRLEKQLAVMEAHPEIDLLSTNMYAIDRDNNITGVRNVPGGAGWSWVHPSILGRTEWFRNNPYDPKAIRQEDVELWLRTWDSSVFWNMEEPLIFIREFGGTYWRKYFAGLKGVFYFINKLKLWRKDGFYRVGRYLVACVVYRVAALLGKEDRLIRRRSRPLPPEELLKAQEILKQALR